MVKTKSKNAPKEETKGLELVPEVSVDDDMGFKTVEDRSIRINRPKQQQWAKNNQTGNYNKANESETKQGW